MAAVVERDAGESEHEPGEILISHEQIQARLVELARQVTERYKGQKPLFVGVLTGAFILSGDFAVKLYEAGLTEAEFTFIDAKSYGKGTQAGELKTDDRGINVLGRHVVLLEDIADTGNSGKGATELMIAKGAASVAMLALLDKPSRREVDFHPDYVGFTIEDIWVEGYGMDTGERGRGNPHIIYGPSKV